MKTSKTLLRYLLEMFGLALGLYLLATIAIQAVHLVGSSMDPSLQNNDLVIASRLSTTDSTRPIGATS